MYLQLIENKRDPDDTVAIYVSKLRILWLEFNEKSRRIDKSKLPLTLQLMRILPTLLKNYFEFHTTWESVPSDQRTVEFLLERLTSMVEMCVAHCKEKRQL